MMIYDYPMGDSDISFLPEKKLAIQSYKDLLSELCKLGLEDMELQDITSFFPRYILKFNNNECILNLKIEPHKDYDSYVLFTGSLKYGKFQKFALKSNIDYDIPEIYKKYFNSFLKRIKNQLQ